MRFSIQHETTYRYTSPVSYSIQQLHLTPRADAHQHVLSWHIDAPARLQPFVDACGNVVHTMVLSAPHQDIRIAIRGSLEIEPLEDGRVPHMPGAPGADLSPLVFTVPTPLTTADDRIRALTRDVLGDDRSQAGFLALACAIRDRVQYQGGYTEVTSTAVQALQAGRGVCQDYAHLFIACCRVVGVPARYVSGYVHPGDVPQAASHAWIDVWVDGSGWVSMDVTSGEYAGERHCRLAVGKDYLSAAPIRGVRTGGGEESLDVNVLIRSEQ